MHTLVSPLYHPHWCRFYHACGRWIDLTSRSKILFAYVLCWWVGFESDVVDVPKNPAAMWWLQHKGDGGNVLLKDGRRTELIPLLCLFLVLTAAWSYSSMGAMRSCSLWALSALIVRAEPRQQGSEQGLREVFRRACVTAHFCHRWSLCSHIFTAALTGTTSGMSLCVG